MEQRLPQRNPKRTRHGGCGLCGFEGKLSKTHIPPHAVGNIGKAQIGFVLHDTESGDLTRSHGYASDGGTWGWWLCVRCNNRTEKWEREYRRWVEPIRTAFRQQPPRYGQRIECAMPSADVGAVGRLLWAWMFALDPSMRIFYPEVAEAILSGESCEPPPNRRLLLAATPDARIWISGRDGPWIGHHPMVPRTAISAPPFVVVLADQHYAEGKGCLDVATWLGEPADLRRAVVLDLPVVASFDEDEPLEDQRLSPIG